MARGTFAKQTGDFVNFAQGGAVVPGEDEFFVVDLGIAYRLPRRLGQIGLEVTNLFNQHFQFQDTDPSRSTISRGQVILGTVSLYF